VDPADESEFRDFVVGRSPSYLRTAYLLTGDWAKAEDLLQASLTKVYLAWKRVHDRDNLDAYVRRVMVNTWSSWWRRAWRGESPTEVLPEAPSPDETLVADQRDLIRRALTHLPARQRAAVVLRHYDDLSEAETASVLGCSVGTVKSQTSKGLARLREVLARADEPAPSPASSSLPAPALVGAATKGPQS
jgi:RNA polymerase sigma-70 factor (sigma-E family)